MFGIQNTIYKFLMRMVVIGFCKYLMNFTVLNLSKKNFSIKISKLGVIREHHKNDVIFLLDNGKKCTCLNYISELS